MNWTRDGNQFTINFISPSGQMTTRQLRFSIVLRPGNNFQADTPATVTRIKLYDIDGLPTSLSGGSADEDLFTIEIE